MAASGECLLRDGEESHSSVEEAVKLSTNGKIIVVVEL